MNTLSDLTQTRKVVIEHVAELMTKNTLLEGTLLALSPAPRTLRCVGDASRF